MPVSDVQLAMTLKLMAVVLQGLVRTHRKPKMKGLWSIYASPFPRHFRNEWVNLNPLPLLLLLDGTYGYVCAEQSS